MPHTEISALDMAHILTNHVRLCERESFSQNKGVFNPNWLFTIDGNFEQALRSIAQHVVDSGEKAPTEGAVVTNSMDYYYNFNKKTGFQGIDIGGNIVWYKGVVVRGLLDEESLTVKTMFPKSLLKF
jgi:hypothetical protein